MKNHPHRQRPTAIAATAPRPVRLLPWALLVGLVIGWSIVHPLYSWFI